MADTQTSLTTHLNRIRELEGQLQQQEAMKHDIAIVRQQMEDSKNEMEVLLSASQRMNGANGAHHDDDDDDDARSVVTVMPDDDRQNGHSADGAESSEKAAPAEAAASNNDLAERIQSLTVEMEDALQMSRTLQTQHGEAMATVKLLTDRLDTLESGIADRVTAAVAQAEERWSAWRSKFEDRWKHERDGWESERERLRGIVREWEEASRRAVEEEEEREMNEHLSEDELADEEEDDAGQEDVEAGELLAVHNRWPNGRTLDAVDGDIEIADVVPRTNKPRRRRPSTKTSLAMRSLRAVTDLEGTATPKALAESPVSEAPRPRELRRDALSRVKRMSARDKFARSSSAPGAFNDKESSESGRESADTLRGDKDVAGDRKLDHPSANTLPPVSTTVTCDSLMSISVHPNSFGNLCGRCGWTHLLPPARLTPGRRGSVTARRMRASRMLTPTGGWRLTTTMTMMGSRGRTDPARYPVLDPPHIPHILHSPLVHKCKSHARPMRKAGSWTGGDPPPESAEIELKVV